MLILRMTAPRQRHRSVAQWIIQRERWHLCLVNLHLEGKVLAGEVEDAIPQ